MGRFLADSSGLFDFGGNHNGGIGSTSF
jgi:hypothetical protein